MGAADQRCAARTATGWCGVRCERCDRVLQDGDTAYEIGVKRITVRGKTVKVFNVEIYVCEYCVKVEEGEYR